MPIDSQLDQCQRKAEELGSVVAKVFADEGISGRSDARPQFQAAIAYCESFDIDYFICWSTSRFARNRLDAQLNKRRLQSGGTKVEYVSVSFDEGGSGMLHEGILELFDEHLSHQISADTRRSMIKNARDGFWNGGVPPFGYKAEKSPENPKKKRLVPDSYESDIVQQIFKMRLQGLGGRSIAQVLNDRGVRNKQKPWNKTSVTSLLRNERLLGKTIFGQKLNGVRQPRDRWVIVDSHTPIIDEILFEEVQMLMNSESILEDGSSPHSTWSFTGILKCGDCGSSLQIESAKGRTQRYHYYNCRSAQKGYGCKNRRLRADIMDEFLNQAILRKVLTRENVAVVLDDVNEMYGDWAKQNKKKRVSLARKLADLKARNSKLYELLEDPAGAFNLEDLAPRLRENNAEIKQIERDISVIDNQRPPKVDIDETYLDDIVDFLRQKVLENESPKATRRFYKSFIDQIVVGDDEVTITYSRDSLLNASTVKMVHSSENWLPELGSNQRPTD